MVLDHSSTDSKKKSLGYRRQGGGGQGDQAAVSRVKELVVGVSHQTASCSGSLTRSLSFSLSLSLSGPCGCARKGGRERSASV